MVLEGRRVRMAVVLSRWWALGHGFTIGAGLLFTSFSKDI